MEAMLLGPFTVAEGGRSLKIGGGKEAAVAALLACRAGGSVSTAAVIDALWGDDPPRTAAKTLQGYVSRLRRAGLNVVSSGHGYEIPGLTTDAARFEELLEAARAERAAGGASRAAVRLRAALAVWRGPALAEFAEIPALASEAGRLEELRLYATEERVDADLAVGRHAELAGEIASLLSEHPYRERLWRQLILALYRSGRQADALAAFQRCRHRLVEDLGVEPGTELRELERAVLAQDEALNLPRLSRPGQSGTVTILATDIVGSTQRWEADSSAMARAVARHDQLVVAEIETCGGERFKATGDGHFAVFPVAADAVSAAASIQRAVSAEGWADVGGLSVRVAVATGVAEPRDGDWFGPAVNRAARLLSAGHGGQVLVSDSTARLVAGDLPTGVLLRDLGNHRFKGIPEPEPLLDLMIEGLPCDFPRVSSEPAIPGLALPGSLAMLVASGPFLGREPELAELIQAWKAAADGHTRIVLVGGEPGIGKTRLVAELARTVHLEGATVLHGRADPDGSAPYGPWVEVLSQLAAALPLDVLRDAASGPGRPLLAMVPALARRLRDVETPTEGGSVAERVGLFESVVALLRAAAASGPPSVLILDDVHWSDPASLSLLRHVAHPVDAAPLPLAVLVTYRDTELEAARPLASMLTDFRRDPAARRIALRGLPVEAVAELVGAISGSAAAERADDIYAETDGNPFFVGEVARWLGTGESGSRVPEGVREVVTQRLEVLSDPARRLLTAGAILGPEWNLGAAATLAGLEEGESLDAVEEAARAALVAESVGAADSLLFSHAIIRTTIYETVSAARRSRLHRQAAEVIGPVAPPAEVAHHLFAAGSEEDLLHGSELALRAAEAAAAALAWEEVIRLVDSALEALSLAGADRSRLRGRLLVTKAAALRGVGEIAASLETAAAATEDGRHSGDGTVLADAVLPTVTMSAIDRLDEPTSRLLIEAREAVRGIDPRREVQVLNTEVMWRVFLDPAGAVSRGHEAVAAARAAGDPELLAAALLGLAGALQPTAAAERLAIAQEIRALPGGSQVFTPWAGTVETVELYAALVLGDRAAADHHMEEFERRASPRDMYSGMAIAGRRFHTAASDGRLEEAEQLQNDYLNLSERAVQSFVHSTNVAAVQMVMARARGTFHELEPMIAAMAAMAPRAGMFDAQLATARAYGGNIDGAREVLERLRADGYHTTLENPNPYWPLSLFYLSAASALCDHKETAEAVIEHAAPVADLCAGYFFWIFLGSFHHHLGVSLATLGRYTEAADQLRAALEPERSWGSRLWMANTTDALGAVLQALGDESGDRLRDEAQVEVREMGAALLMERWSPGARPPNRESA